jgi:hypothetical protein
VVLIRLRISGGGAVVGPVGPERMAMALVVVHGARGHPGRGEALALVVIGLARAVDGLLDGRCHLAGHVLVEADVEVVLEDGQAVARPGGRSIDHYRPDGEPRLDAVGGVAAGRVPGGIEGLGLVRGELRDVPEGILGGRLGILGGARVLPGRCPDVPGGILDADADHEPAPLSRGVRRRAERDAAGNREACGDDASPDSSHDQAKVPIPYARCAG